jgi:hypothetical protein
MLNSARRLSMKVSTWVPSAATTDPSPQALIRSSSVKAPATPAMALLSFSTVTCRRAVTESSCAVMLRMCRAAWAGPMLVP